MLQKQASESEFSLTNQNSESHEPKLILSNKRADITSSLNFSGRILTEAEEENMETMGIKASDELYLMLRSYCLMI